MSYEAKHRTFAYLFACAARHLDIARYSEAQGKKTKGSPPAYPAKDDPILVGEWSLTGGSFYDSMSCLTFCALSMEAAVNHIGAEVFETWQTYEKKLSTREKIDLLCALKRRKRIDFSSYPFSDLNRLSKLRNDLAHGKTLTVTADAGPDGVEPDWMKRCNRVAGRFRRSEHTRYDRIPVQEVPAAEAPLLHLASGSGTGRRR